MNKTKTCLYTIAIVSLLSAPLGAQEFQRFTFNGGAGFTNPVGRAGTNVDLGWNVRGGFGVNFTPNFGVNIDAGYDHMGINDTVLNNLGFGGGSLSVFSATLDPIVHLMPKSKVDVYVTGGGGLFHRYQNFTQPTVVTGTGFDPFFGFYQFAAPANVIVASYSVNKPGVDIGAGIGFGSLGHGRFFAEARFNHIYMGSNRTDYIPVTFGYRW